MSRILKLALPVMAAFLMTAASAAGMSSLAGSEWGMADTDRPFIRFEAEGRVAGDAGCNRFFGSYEEDGDALKIGPLGTTRMACIPDMMATEKRFLEALGKAAAFKRNGTKLTISDAAGAPLLELVQHDWD
ncbi:MAG: META domain-containing protein [Nitratireductor sp.]|nr:META domain-containing protein [Nitratireductor sp.]